LRPSRSKSSRQDSGHQWLEIYFHAIGEFIKQLKKTGAGLILVTTCPIPNGCDLAGDLATDGRAPGRTAGVMQKYLNPWALEVMQRHPEISICDQWQYCKNRENDVYKTWWAGNNVHFGGEPAHKLGDFLAEHVQAVANRE